MGRTSASASSPAFAFDLGPTVATAANPIAAAGVPTAIWFEAGRAVEMDHRISVCRLSRDGWCQTDERGVARATGLQHLTRQIWNISIWFNKS